ncbi:MAG TPA: ABC-F family ATP-binding cassette domain-containing protein [Bdellovibrionota bacterium]|jgi:ATP-binding cassette subfamily F protein uup|nr:ABC-F family ATP-binding cassette domain-containing protein [Bdellovibrionota bacterium]
MSLLLSAHEISKSFSHRKIFEKLSFGVREGERVGLIGPNGAGKSTLLKIIAGIEDVDTGQLSRSKGLKMAYLEQDPKFGENATILDGMLEKAAAAGADIHDWEVQSKVYEYLSAMGLEERGFGPDTLISSLSGGWKKRIAFARELILQPNLLLLDEPTNHLDVEGILWLEEFLDGAPFATITITHDRVFLQRVSNVIFELDRRNPGGILRVEGDYATYCEVKANLIGMQEKEESTLKNVLARESEWLRRGAKARTTKQQARINRAHDLMDKVDEVSERNMMREVKIKFQAADKTPKKLIEAKAITKAYGDKIIFKDQDLIIARGTRIGLIGTNGVGKSTLIRCLLGQESVDSGSVVLSENLQVAYFEQTRETLNPEETVLRTVCPQGDHVKFQGNYVHVRSYLDRFLFSAQQSEMPVKKLSGGEQARLLVAKLMLREANLLVLDEPTNDLDLPTLNILEEQLKGFAGAVILVSHDRYFMDQVCDQILAFPVDPSRPGLTEFASLAQWEVWFEEQKARLERASASASSAASAPATASVEKKKLTYNEQRELDLMEPTISKLESRIAELSAETQRPEVVSNAKRLADLYAEMSQAQKEIDTLYRRWEELGQR